MDAVYVNNEAVNEVRRNRTLADFALLYADEGFRILPLQSLRSPGCCSCGSASCSSVAKHPRTINGVKNVSDEPSGGGSILMRILGLRPGKACW